MLTLLNELGHTKKANKIIHLLFLIMLEKKINFFSFSVGNSYFITDFKLKNDQKVYIQKKWQSIRHVSGYVYVLFCDLWNFVFYLSF